MSQGDESWVGRWWLPGRENEAVIGELVLTSNEFILKLSGELASGQPKPLSQKSFSRLFRPVDEPIILGETVGGESLTLLDCDGASSELPVAMSRSSWLPDAALIGTHLEEPGDVAFTGVRAEFDYLRDWAEASLHRAVAISKSGRSEHWNVDLETEIVGAASIGLASAQLRTVRYRRLDNRRAEIELRPNVRVEFAEAIGWREVMRAWIRPLRDLVSFATLRGARIEDVQLRPRGLQEGVWPRLVLRWIDLGRSPRGGRDLLRQDMLFTAQGFPGGFEPGLRRWFELHTDRSSVMDLMFSVDYAPFLYGEQRFLMIAQAAEIFHRIAVGGLRLPKQEHKRRVDLVLETISDPELGDWARPILQQANYLRLAERIEGLVAPLGKLGEEICGGDPARFVRRIVDTRNYLTHLDERKPTVLDEGRDRYWHGQALIWLVRAWLLEELGMPRQQVATSLKGNGTFGTFVQEMRDVS